MGLWTKKSIAVLQAEAAGESTEHTLRRALGALNLTTLGIGAIIGAGIFVLTGTAAAKFAGPAIVLSFIVSGFGCLFAGLCYAEFASMIPIAGSAYTYGYATLGEFVAWIIGWDLILEYLFGASTVAVGWSGYFTAFMKQIGITMPTTFTSSQWSALKTAFPHGVCDYSKPGVLQHGATPWLTYQDAGGRVVYGGRPLGAAPASASFG